MGDCTRGLAVVASIGLAGLLAWLIVQNWVNVPLHDHYDLVAEHAEWQRDGLSTSELVSFHNEHRIVIPRLLIFGLAPITSWDVRAEMVASFTLAVAATAVLVRLLRSSADGSPTLHLALVLGVAASVLSPVQYENWLWGFEVTWFLAVFGVVVAIYVLHSDTSHPARRVLGAGAACLVAQYSLLSGALGWIVVIPLLLRRGTYRRFVPWWIGCAALSVAAHAIGLQRPPGYPPTARTIGDVPGVLEYFLTLLGRPLSADLPAATVIGAVMLSILVTSTIGLLRRGQLDSALPWLSLAAFGLGAAAMTALGRAGYGVRAAMLSRYSTTSVLLVAATLVLGAQWLQKDRDRSPFTAPLLFAGFLLLTVTSWVDGARAMEDTEEQNMAARECFQTVDRPNDPCIELLGLDRDGFLFTQVQHLRSMGWGPKADGT